MGERKMVNGLEMVCKRSFHTSVFRHSVLNSPTFSMHLYTFFPYLFLGEVCAR